MPFPHRRNPDSLSSEAAFAVAPSGHEHAVGLLRVRFRLPGLLHGDVAEVTVVGVCEDGQGKRRVFFVVELEVDRVVVDPAQLLDARV